MDSWQRFNPSSPSMQGAPNMEDLLAWDRRGRNPYSGGQQQPGGGANLGGLGLMGRGGSYYTGGGENQPPISRITPGQGTTPGTSPLPQLSPYNGGTYQNPGARLYEAPSPDGQTLPQPWQGGNNSGGGGSPPTPGLPAPAGPWVDPASVNDLLRGMNRGGNFGGDWAGGVGGMAGGASRPSRLGDPVPFNKWRGIA